MPASGSSQYTKVEYPEGIDDHAGIVKYVDRVTLDRGFRIARVRNDLRNIFFYMGIQWIVYDDALRTFRPVGFRKTTPRPITNIIAPLVNHTSSRLVNFKPPVTVVPTGLEAADVTAALVGDKIVNVLEKEIQARVLRPIAAKWVCTTGDVFLIQGYDGSEESGTTFVAHERCTVCNTVSNPLEIVESENTCPACGAAEQFEPAAKADGTLEGEYAPIGKHVTEVKPFFNCYFDAEVQTIYDSEYFVISEAQPLEWIVRTYGEKAIDGIQLHTYRDFNQWYIEAVAFATSGSSRQAWGGQASGRTIEKGRVRRIWIKPHPKRAPRGIYAVIVGEDKVVEARDWPYHDEHGNPFLNVVHIKFDDVSGRLTGRSRVDDLAPKQEIRNYIEAHLLIHTRRMANAMWMLPYGMGMSRVTGEGGLYVRYTPLAGAPAPKREQGLNPPAYLIEWMRQIDREADTIWGTYDVNRGEAPGGVPSYAALSLLDERAQQGQSSLFENWAYGWLQVYRQHLNIWREYADAERTYAVGGGAWAVEKFNSAKLEGGMEIDVDVGQFRPKSIAGIRASLDLALQRGLINAQDPQQAFRALTFLGLPELMEDYRLDWEEANRENDDFLAEKPLNTPLPWQNSMVHIRVHRPLLLTDKFRALPPEKQDEFHQHLMLHLQGAMMAQPPSAGGSPPGAPEMGGGGQIGPPETPGGDMGESETMSASHEQGMES